MNKTLKTSLVALWLLAFGFAITSKVNALEANGDVNLTVTEWALTISTSGATVDLWSVTSTDTEQVLSGQFSADSFIVSDLKWAESGYVTTIQVSDLTGTINGEIKTISKDNVKFRAWLVTPHKISGDENPAVIFDSEISTDKVIATPQQYIKRNNGGGILWVYGDAPRVTVTIPAYTPATTYHGVITYTLIDND